MKLPKFSQHGIAHIIAPIAFIGIFAVIGGIVLLKSKAAVLPDGGGSIPQTQTVYFSGVSSIIPNTPYSAGYKIVYDQLGTEVVKVAYVNPGGYVDFGGKGGGSTATPLAQEKCYVVKGQDGTQVQLAGLNGGLVTKQVKSWPYNSGPTPYQDICVTNGVMQNTLIPAFKVVSGASAPVFFYGVEYLNTYPY